MTTRIRRATKGDVDAILDVQEPGAVAGLGHIFPQDCYPFPRDDVRARWLAEFADPNIVVVVAVDDTGAVIGFAATRGTELLHFGTALGTWGSGVAAELHDGVLGTLRTRFGPDATANLRVFEENHRARRFYERRGWCPTGGRSRSAFPPHAVLLDYVVNVSDA